MKSFLTAAFALALVGTVPVGLVGCETEEQMEVESDGDVDYDTEIGVDEAALENAGDEAGAALDEAGAEIRDAASDAENAIDENIDLGDNAGTPEVDDNN